MDTLKSIDCVCIKCSSKFVSQDQADFDGDAFCPGCKAKNKEIAAKIDAQIALRRGGGKVEPAPSLIDQMVGSKRKGGTRYLRVGRH